MDAVATADATSGATERVRADTRRIALIAAAIYLAIALWLTWPLVLRPGEVLFGEVIDLHGGIAFLDARIDEGINPFLPGRIDDFNLAGGGAEIAWQTHLATVPSTALLTILGLLFGATAAYGLFAVLGYVVSGMAMMMLLLRLRAQPAVAVLLGAAFAYWPFASLSGGIPEFIHQWVLVGIAWRGVELAHAPNTRNGVLFGLAFALAAVWTPYYLLLGGVLAATLGLGALVMAVRSGSGRRMVVALFVAGAVVAPLIVGLYALSISGTGTSQIPDRNQFELYAYSARPSDYVLPPPENPLVGERIADWVRERRVFEGSGGPYPLYLGVLVILGAFAALWAAVRRRVPWSDPRIALFLPVVAAGAAFSGPPKLNLGGLVVPMPPLAVFDFVSTAWRIYSRFAVVVMLGAVVMASLGLSWALSRWRGRAYASAVALVAVLAAADYLVTPKPSVVRPGGATAEVRIPELYQRLRALGPGGVADYPIKSAGQRAYNDLFYQRFHGHPVLSGYPGGSEGERRALEAIDVNDPLTHGRLLAMGVRYVVVPKHPVFPDPAPPAQPEDRRDYRQVFEDDYGVLYQLADR
jgi:hypothetical protein